MTENEKLGMMWTELTDMLGISDETLQCVTSLNGYSEDTLRDVMYWKAGTRDFDCDY